jgi:hypothetical protein
LVPMGSERLRDGEGGDERSRRGQEQRGEDGGRVGVRDVRQPGLARPDPPEDGEREQPAVETSPGLVIEPERRQLGEREDEHEVEEQVDRGDAMLPLQRKLTHGDRSSH